MCRFMCCGGFIDNTGTAPCVFKDVMMAGPDEIAKFYDAFPKTKRGKVFKIVERYSGSLGLFTKDSKTGLFKPCSCMDKKIGICTWSKLNMYVGCQNLKKLLEQFAAGEKNPRKVR